MIRLLPSAGIVDAAPAVIGRQRRIGRYSSRLDPPAAVTQTEITWLMIYLLTKFPIP